MCLVLIDLILRLHSGQSSQLHSSNGETFDGFLESKQSHELSLPPELEVDLQQERLQSRQALQWLGSSEGFTSQSCWLIIPPTVGIWSKKEPPSSVNPLFYQNKKSPVVLKKENNSALIFHLIFLKPTNKQ